MFIADGVFRKYIALSEDFLDGAFDVAGQKPFMELSAEEGSFSGKDANGASKVEFLVSCCCDGSSRNCGCAGYENHCRSGSGEPFFQFHVITFL